MRWPSRFCPLLLALLCAVYGCRFFGPPKRSTCECVAMGPRIGAAAPDIDGEDIAGAPLRLSDYRGKVVVLSFWGNF